MANNVTLCGKSTTGVITSPGSQTKPAVEEVKATSNAIHVAIATLQAGDDETNNVKVVEQGQFGYETVAVSQTDQVLGATGATGDFLHKLIITVATAATGAVSIKDGAGSAISILPNSPGGGIGVYEVEFNAVSSAGAWKVTTGAGSTVLAIGRFT